MARSLRAQRGHLATAARNVVKCGADRLPRGAVKDRRTPTRKDRIAASDTVSDIILARQESLTPAERRLARIAFEEPELLAFGNCGSVAIAASTSPPSVVRFAVKLGFGGFVDLQAAVRTDLSNLISSPYRRARVGAANSDLNAWVEVESLNVREALIHAWPKLPAATQWLAYRERTIFILASEQWSGPTQTFADFLALVRDGVQRLGGTPFRIISQLGMARRGDVVVTMDARRNETWLIEAHALARRTGLTAIAITDSPLDPVAIDSDLQFKVWRATRGMFES